MQEHLELIIELIKNYFHKLKNYIYCQSLVGVIHQSMLYLKKIYITQVNR